MVAMSDDEIERLEDAVRDVLGMVPGEGESRSLTRDELLEAIALAWSCGQSMLALNVIRLPTSEMWPLVDMMCRQALEAPASTRRIMLLALEGTEAAGCHAVVTRVRREAGHGE